MPQPTIPPGLDSVRSGLAPFSAEALAVHDLMTAARSVEHECDGPTKLALERLFGVWHTRNAAWQTSVLSALLTAALLEASRG